MAVTKQFTQLDPINNGTTPADNFKLSDVIPAQHTDLTGGVNKLVHRTLAQSMCEPVAVCNSNNPQNGAYVATCQNYPDFALSYQDAQQNTKYLIGLKIRVIFTYGITYGSVSGGTYPTLNINGSGAIPMLAQGKTMATGSASAGQTLEFTVIPYGNGIAFDADSNVRESTSDYTIYTDGSKKYTTHYDLTEHIVGVWTDGTTPVYERSFVYNFISNSTYAGYVNGSETLTNLNRVIALGGMINAKNANNNSSFCMVIPFNDQNSTRDWFTYVNYNFDVGKIYFSCCLTSGLPIGTNVQVIITIRYTKTS